MLNKVWFTYKARIQAHHRLEWMDTHSQFLLVWYAILGAALAVVAIRYPTLLGKNTDILVQFCQLHCLVYRCLSQIGISAAER